MTKSALFVDINVFANERFSSGLFKYIKEILLRLRNNGMNVSILSLAHYLRPQNIDEKKVGRLTKMIDGIRVHEYLLQKTPIQDPTEYVKQLKLALLALKPNIIFVNSVAVFLDEYNITILEELINSGPKIVTFIVDNLFPTPTTHPVNKVKRYYSLIAKTEIISVSYHIINRLKNELGLTASYFPNLFSPQEIISNHGKHEFISMINIHPIKGITIFDEIAKRMNDRKFLIIKNWPDVPLYNPPSNVQLRGFFKNIKEFYGQTKILLVPSLMGEGLPRVITEAMMNGIPVIANAASRIPEVGSPRGLFLVKTPKVKNVVKRGTILYPQIARSELIRVVNEYVTLISDIDTRPDQWRKYSKNIKSSALKSYRSSEKVFGLYFKNWMKEIE